MKPISSTALGLSLAVSLTVGLAALPGQALAAGHPPFRMTPTPGVRAYRYEVTETVNGAVQKRYRMDFDFEADRAGTLYTIVRSAQESDGGAWRPVAVTEACRAKMHAPRHGLARLKLLPVTLDVARGLGPDFLDECAPGGIFFPLTDILNVAVIINTPQFKIQALRKVGDSAHYDGFTAAFDRAGETLKETTHGGEVRLVALDRRKAVIDWAPATADLELSEHAQGPPVNLKGTEHWAFRIELGRKTGALIRGRTTYDDLDLLVAVPGVPADKGPRVKISRLVSIEPRGGRK